MSLDGVRELRNVADRMVLGLPPEEAVAAGADSGLRPLDEQVAIFERHLIPQALAQCVSA